MPLLELNAIAKSFGGTQALRGISIAIESGEVVGLIGENGAGKSTLIKILSGVHRPDSGTILWQGAPLHLTDPHAALNAGIATIHQELASFEKLTVAENLILGEEWPRSRWGGIDWGALNQIAAERLEANGLKMAPHTLFHSLSAAQRQEIAIARALSRHAKLLVLDEPTASLTEPEVERLLSQVRVLKSKGVAVLYVSHRLDEILQLTDRVVVLRDGALAAQYSTADTTINKMVRDMVGRELTNSHVREPRALGLVVFEVEKLSRPPLFEGITFKLRAGEVLGLAGLVGAGRSEFARAAFGLYRSTGGLMKMHGRSYAPTSPSDARRAGVVYLPEERKRQGFVLSHSLRAGISIGLLNQLSRFGWVRHREERNTVSTAAERYRVKHHSIEQPVGTLSGGNQQKALLARWLETNPDLIILDEPTRGVDVGAKAEIHRLILALAGEGRAVLLISSDLPELLSLSDRILVLHRGRMAAEVSAQNTTQEEILVAASGLTVTSRQ